MKPRSELHTILLSILGSGNVYFQPPPNLIMSYPCIRYERDYAKTEFANDKPYTHQKRYLVTVIDRDPDSDIPGKVAQFPTCVFDRHYTADQLHHDVYKLFF